MENAGIKLNRMSAVVASVTPTVNHAKNSLWVVTIYWPKEFLHQSLSNQTLRLRLTEFWSENRLIFTPPPLTAFFHHPNIERFSWTKLCLEHTHFFFYKHAVYKHARLKLAKKLSTLLRTPQAEILWKNLFFYNFPVLLPSKCRKNNYFSYFFKKMS